MTATRSDAYACRSDAARASDITHDQLARDVRSAQDAGLHGGAPLHRSLPAFSRWVVVIVPHWGVYAHLQRSLEMGEVVHFLLRVKKVEDLPSSLFFGLRLPWHPLRNSRRCWRRCRGAAKREGGWAPSPRGSRPEKNGLAACREGPSAFARTTSPHPPRRSPSSDPTLITPSMAHLHTP